ncbi:MAG: homoserine O-succinyltransferase [Gammaproteobacteria bacterium]|nr:homoserine O-succinyltransferase [Gammaproteobacteria bacterium]MDH4314330.1 homoserine O-succinyltransferase [Gammaproteobacteria bacterium]
MPLVAHNELPAFRRLRESGQSVLSLDRARKQDIRELHIGLLNMMPDAALAATEEQFIRLVGNCNQIAQFYVYPFSLPELNRSPQADAHIDRYYFKFEQLRAEGLDALIITGANVANPSLDQEPFWEPLTRVVRWAEDNVASILCSCLATHALVKHLYGVDRHRLAQKKWGVYSHRISRVNHPLMRDINTRFDAPHSRYNEVRKDELEAAGINVLVESAEAGVHLAVSPDQFRSVYFQGHPEYSAVSLLKEYKREVLRYLGGELEAPPPFPEHYFSAEAADIALQFLERARKAKSTRGSAAEFPEQALAALVDNTWGDTGKTIVNNWLGLVYQLTNLDRKLQFMPDVDPQDPLQLRGRASA